MALRDEQIDFYSRQIILRELGGIGQQRLLAARCLIAGSGDAFEFAASYLAGAGVGRIDRFAVAVAVAEPAALAPLAERNPDVRLRALEEDPVDPNAYDAAILGVGEAASRLATGRAAQGEVGIGPASDGGVELCVVPASAAGCVTCSMRESAARPVILDTVHDAFAGTMAALVVLRWLAGLAPDEPARRLILRASTPTWQEEPLTPHTSCSRPCRS